MPIEQKPGVEPEVHRPLISIVSPVYKAEEIIDELVSRVVTEASKITDQFEVILVEDGSPDQSWAKIEAQCVRNYKIKGIKLSRNFGQHYAVTAGLEAATGEAIVIMDCDLQDDPRHIRKLYERFRDGFDVVFTRRVERSHSLLKSVGAKAYNALFALLADKSYDVNVGSLTLISRRVRSEFVRLKDKDRLYIQLIKWIGFKSTYVSVEHMHRYAGKTTYSLAKLLLVALQGLTSHSDKLLRLSIYGGFLLSLVTFVIGVGIVFRHFVQQLQAGWPSLFVAIMFSTGLILMSIGFAGIYVGKTFEQSKGRPLFIIDRSVNLNEQSASCKGPGNGSGEA